MQSKNLFTIPGIGIFDLARVGGKGAYTNICFMIFRYRPSKRRKDKTVPPKAIRVRLKDRLTIKFGLHLPKPWYMPHLESELIMIDEKNRMSVYRRVGRIGDGMVKENFDLNRSRFSPLYRRFFHILKDVLKAENLNCRIHFQNPGYVEITATLSRYIDGKQRTFEYLARMTLDIVTNCNYELNK